MPASRLLSSLSLRDLIWLLVVMAMGAGWWRDSQVLKQHVTHGEDSAILLRADNAVLEQQNEVHRLKLRKLHLERQSPKTP